MVINTSVDRLKLSFEIKLIGGCTIQIRPVTIDKVVGNSQNCVLYICNDGYVFEKRYYDMVYSPHRLIIPPYINYEKGSISYVYSFLDDKSRYNYLKILKRNLAEYTSCAFGHNPHSRVLTYSNFWFVY